MTLVLDKVSTDVGATVHIRDVSLTLERGSLNVLLGATLAGKTSLMRLMAGLDVPSRGRVSSGLEEMCPSRWSAEISNRRSASWKTVSEGEWPGR